MLGISTGGVVSVPKKVGVGKISPSAFRRRIVREWHPLGCRAIELGKPPQEGVIYTMSYTVARVLWEALIMANEWELLLWTAPKKGGPFEAGSTST